MLVISQRPSILATSMSAAVTAATWLCLDVDVVALEVQRAPVTVDRDLDLVRGVVRDPVRPGLNASDFSQTFRICSFPAAVCPGPNVRVAFGAHRLIIMVDVLLASVALWKSLSIWLIA